MHHVTIQTPAVNSPASDSPDPKPKAAKVKVNVLKCRGEACGGLLAFEETDRGYLLGRVLELAVADGEKRFLPCPKCGGRQLVEEYEQDGKRRVRVTGFEPGAFSSGAQ